MDYSIIIDKNRSSITTAWCIYIFMFVDAYRGNKIKLPTVGKISYFAKII